MSSVDVKGRNTLSRVLNSKFSAVNRTRRVSTLGIWIYMSVRIDIFIKIVRVAVICEMVVRPTTESAPNSEQATSSTIFLTRPPPQSVWSVEVASLVS